MKGKILRGRCLESSLPVKRLWNIGVNRRIHIKRRILDSDKKYSGILFLFWMECPYFAFKMEKEKKLGELKGF